MPHSLKGVDNKYVFGYQKMNEKTKQYLIIFAIIALFLSSTISQIDPDIYIETPWITFVGNGIIAIPLFIILYDWYKSRNK